LRIAKFMAPPRLVMYLIRSIASSQVESDSFRNSFSKPSRLLSWFPKWVAFVEQKHVKYCIYYILDGNILAQQVTFNMHESFIPISGFHCFQHPHHNVIQRWNVAVANFCLGTPTTMYNWPKARLLKSCLFNSLTVHQCWAFTLLSSNSKDFIFFFIFYAVFF
jgi:hypothetical protein